MTTDRELDAREPWTDGRLLLRAAYVLEIFVEKHDHATPKDYGADRGRAEHLIAELHKRGYSRETFAQKQSGETNAALAAVKGEK